MTLGESWKLLTQIGHEASLIFIGVSAVVILVLYIRYRRNKKNRENVNMD